MLKPIHNQGIDMVRTIGNYTLQSLALFIMENVLFGIIHLNNKDDVRNFKIKP